MENSVKSFVSNIIIFILLLINPSCHVAILAQDSPFDIVYSPPYTNDVIYNHNEDITGLELTAVSFHNFNRVDGYLEHGCNIVTLFAGLNSVYLHDELYTDFTVDKTGNYTINFTGYVTGGFWNISN